MTRKIDLIVVHCSATTPSMNWGVDDIRLLHKRVNGWSDVGYHYVIKRDGQLQFGRSLEKAGAHVRGHNRNSIGICLVGGINFKGRAENNYTVHQWKTLEHQLRVLRDRFPKTRICGHRDLSPDLNNDGTISANEWVKQCPCFDVAKWCKSVDINPVGMS
jgi:N-acetylmuramoyl-L-alanine amidase